MKKKYPGGGTEGVLQRFWGNIMTDASKRGKTLSGRQEELSQKGDETKIITGGVLKRK